jgi:hypothetical protein
VWGCGGWVYSHLVLGPSSCQVLAVSHSTPLWGRRDLAQGFTSASFQFSPSTCVKEKKIQPNGDKKKHI